MRVVGVSRSGNVLPQKRAAGPGLARMVTHNSQLRGPVADVHDDYAAFGA